MGGSECPGNEDGTGLGGLGDRYFAGRDNVYVTGDNDIAEFARGATQTLTVSLAGSGSGAVSDGTGAIACPSTCSNAYTTNTTGHAHRDPRLRLDVRRLERRRLFRDRHLPGDDERRHGRDRHLHVDRGPHPRIAHAGPDRRAVRGHGWRRGVLRLGQSGRHCRPPPTSSTAWTRNTARSAHRARTTRADGSVQTVGSDFTTHGVGPVTVTGLVPNALYHVRLVATNSAGTTFGQDVTFTTAMAPAPGAPTLGKSFNIQPVSGLVLDLHQWTPGTADRADPDPGRRPDRHPPRHTGADHRDRRWRWRRSARCVRQDAAWRVQRRGVPPQPADQRRRQGPGHDHDGAERVQGRSEPGDLPKQRSRGRRHAASSRVIQLLHASAHGKFRTSGRYSAATVLGTIWTVSARCDGTLTHAIKDEVQVTDFVRHKTIILHAGQSYLAPGPFKRP